VDSAGRRGETGTDRPHETGAERDDRNLLELLQELRVAGLGVQVLFGFMLSLPFTTRFVKLSHPQRDLYVASLLLAAISTALLMALDATRAATGRGRNQAGPRALTPGPPGC